MALSSVHGLDRFAKYMSGLEDSYAVIGGAACDVVLRDADLAFRATRDIDLVLVVENNLPETAKAVWSMVKDGKYSLRWKSSERVHFYRFTNPQEPGFPSMIELFSKAPSFLDYPEGTTIAPLPINDEISSLSAILLDEDYYAFMKSGRKTVNGVTVLDEAHLVPFKAKAFLDLTERKAAGMHVDSRDLKKHKNDVFRLMQLFTTTTAQKLPASIEDDMAKFCQEVADDGISLKQLGVPMTLDEAIGLLRHVYGLGKPEIVPADMKIS